MGFVTTLAMDSVCQCLHISIAVQRRRSNRGCNTFSKSHIIFCVYGNKSLCSLIILLWCQTAFVQCLHSYMLASRIKLFQSLCHIISKNKLSVFLIVPTTRTKHI